MEKYQFSRTELSFIENSRIPFAVYQFIDKRVVTLALSKGFCDLLGCELDEAYRLMDNDMYADTHPDDVARIADAALRFATEDEEYSVVYRTKVGEGYRIVHARGEHIYTENGVRLAVVWYTNEGEYADDPESFDGSLNRVFIKALHEETIYQANHYDHLTGLPNMTYFFELAEAGRDRLLAEGKEPIMLFINLKGMKGYNSKYGFAEGDRLLNAVAKILVRYFSNENCSRFAQDHFTAFTGMTRQDLEVALNAIFAECETINDGCSLPMSVGIYSNRIGTVDVGVACDRAKYASDLSQESYGSTFRYFDEDMLENTQNNQYIIDNLDRALEEGWITVYYQAIVRASNGRVCDEEALARWIDPEKGLLSPLEFIPVLEDAKLIYKLDLYVIEEVLGKIKRQADAGLYVVPQSVNLSRVDFDTCDIVEMIRQRVDDAGIERSKLTIEITESVIGSNFEFMKEQVRRFRELGFPVWMDDFGSGYSSLDVLQSIRFDLIKFDMRFMERFNDGDESKIIMTELMKMAIGLGIDTVAEGVETKEQVDFLREIGCGKLQGYYFTRPVPLEEIVERNRLGTQIGFENPAETDYFVALGKINLYDLAAVAHDDQGAFQQYFDTLPMAIFETFEDECWITRCNTSYRDFMGRMFGVAFTETGLRLAQQEDGTGALFLDALKRCAEEEGLVVLDEEMASGETAHIIIRRIAKNPVTGTMAVVVAVLAVVGNDGKRSPITYAHIAKALSADYRYLYYVDLDTERFVEYSSDAVHGDLAIERHGEQFFEASRRDAQHLLHEADRANFVQQFTKDNVVRTMDEGGSFTITYRLLVEGVPRYVSMKAVRMAENDSHIIIGVSDVDAQMRQRKAFERITAERVAYARIMALSDGYICMYSVDPKTNQFVEYSSTSEYAELELPAGGEDFFNRAIQESKHALHVDDQERFASAFTKANVLDEIERNGRFILKYRLIIEGEPTPVTLKAAIVEEAEGPRLIIGVS